MPSAQPPVRRSYSGSISRAATFQLPARAESWATSMSKKKKLKLKIVRVSSYQIQFDEMEDWLATRYDKIIKTEMNLKEDDDWFIFNIPADDSFSQNDKAAIEGVRKA